MASDSSIKRISDGKKAKRAEIKEQYKRSAGKKTLFTIFSLLLLFGIAIISPSIGSADISLSDTYVSILHKFSPDRFNPAPKEIRYLFSVDNRSGLEEDLNRGILPEELKQGLEEKRRLSTSATVTKAEEKRWVIRDERSGDVREYIIRKTEDGKLNIYDALESYKIVIMVWKRVNKVIMGLLAGLGLAIAGTTMQGVLRNPLASPFTLGIASTAAFGGMLGSGFGGKLGVSPYVELSLTIITAFIFAFLPFLLFQQLSKYRGVTSEMMILGGVALMFTFFPMTYLAGLSGIKPAPWVVLYLVSIIIAICILLLMLKSWDLNTLSAGDDTAKSLGINVERTRVICLALASLAVAAVVSFAGIFAFIGLIAPFICRGIIGSDNRFLIPASGLIGASLLLGLDGFVGISLGGAIPVGIFTMFLGGPLLFYLAIRRKKESF